MKQFLGVHFFLCVWGQYHTDLLINYCLPTIMSPGNLPSLPDGTDKKLWLFTTPYDLTRIQSSPLYQNIKNMVQVEISLLEENSTSCPTKAVNRCYRSLLQNPQYNDEPIVWLPPDVLWADGALSRLVACGFAGKKLVTVPYLRVGGDNYLPVLASHPKVCSGGHISLSARELVSMALPNIHPTWQVMTWNNAPFTSWPCQLYWNVGNKGYVARYFHSFPALTRPGKVLPEIVSSESIDGGRFLSKAFECPEDIHVFQDSDQAFCLEIARDEYHVHPVNSGKQEIREIALWALKNTKEIHRFFFQHRIVIRSESDNCDSEGWREMESNSDQAASAVFYYIRLFESAPELVESIKEQKRFDHCLVQGRPYFGAILAAQQGQLERYALMGLLIRDLCNKRLDRPLKILEVGSWAGGSALVWADAIRKYNEGRGCVVCVDPWAPYLNPAQGEWYNVMEQSFSNDQIYQLFLHNIRSAGYDDLVIALRGKSVDILPLFTPHSFDVVYIDGDHRYSSIVNDLKLALPLVAESGVICGDDLELQFSEIDAHFAYENSENDFGTDPRTGEDYHPGVTRAVHELLGSVSAWQGFWAMKQDQKQWGKIQLSTETLPSITIPDFFVSMPTRLPQLVGSFREFNVIIYDGKYFALAQSLGPTDLDKLSEAEIIKLQNLGSCYTGSSFDDVKEKILGV